MHETRILGHTSAPVWLGERILTASCCNCWGDCWFKTCFADQNSFGSRLKSSCHGLLFPLMDDDPSTSEPIADGQFNLVLCVVSSAVAGIGIGLFGCLLSAADHMKRRNSGVHTSIGRTFQICGICGSIVFGLASLVGLIFGSVSLATVVRAGSTLPSNAIFSQLLGLRPLVRDDVLGTLVTISGIVSFTIFQGWAFYQHSREECLLRISSPGSLIWLCFLVISQAVSVGFWVLWFGTFCDWAIWADKSMDLRWLMIISIP